MHLIDAETLHRLLDYRELVDALRQSHCQEMPATQETVLNEPASDSGRCLILLPAWQRGDLIGTKLVTVFPDNPNRPVALPSNQGIYAAFDARTGVPVLVADGTALTLRKTAAESALAADILAPGDARNLLMIGAGALAPHVIAAMRAVRPSIDTVWIWNRSPQKAADLAARLTGERLKAEAVTELDDYLGRADIVSSATMARSPLVSGDRLSPGCHVDLIGGWAPEMREADNRTMQLAKIFTTSREHCRECGDFVQPIEDGIIGWDNIQADLFELCEGTRPGRTRMEDITLYKNCGGGHLDLFVAGYLLQKL